MLTDAALKCLKPKAKMYKVTDRDGMYVRVAPSGGISFRLDYRLNGRRETVHLGKYARDGISLARARELCIDARRAIAEGRSPAIEKQREKRRIKEAKSFGEFGEKWLTASAMADSTRAMRRSIFERELRPVWRNRLLTEITPDDLRALCTKIVVAVKVVAGSLKSRPRTAVGARPRHAALRRRAANPQGIGRPGPLGDAATHVTPWGDMAHRLPRYRRLGTVVRTFGSRPHGV